MERKNLTKKIFTHIIAITLASSFVLPNEVFGSNNLIASKSASNDLLETKATQSETKANINYASKADENNETVTYKFSNEKGIFSAGISDLITGTNFFEIATPYKTPGEIDWEVRADAVKGYKNFGIAVVNSFVNIRKKPSEDADVIGKMTNYNACDIIGKSKDKKWYKIKSGKVTGWVSKKYIKTGWEGIDLGKAEASLQIKITVDTLNVREEPDQNSKAFSQVDVNEKYDVVNNLGEWVEIELDEETGFVKAEYVEQTYSLNTAVKYTPPASQIAKTKRDKLVANAMKYLGGRYVWGGETLGKGVDCSGFVMKLYQQFGIYLTHYTGSMAYEGTKIKRSELKKGDLIFYARHGSINHVAMYIGDGQVIHARSPKRGICITDMDYRTPVRYVKYFKN